MKKKIVVAVLLVLAIGLIYVTTAFKVKRIQVTGCDTVDEQVIVDSIKSRRFSNNTITMYLYNKFNPIDDIAFVDKLEIEFVSRNEVSVIVYEKLISGCVEYMNRYVFFDKDGIILESASEPIEGVPCIDGLSFDSWEVGEQLPIDDVSKFQAILSITQLIEKYELSIDRIKFTNEGEIVLIYDKIEIQLGSGQYLEIQMMNLGSILEGLEGMEGTLYMKDFNSDDATASFSKKK
ncbi:MAG: cell division protein FtsQ/DivIB [Wujia sp.]